MKGCKSYLYLDTRVKKSNGKYPLKIVVYVTPKQSQVSTGYYFTQAEWDIIQDHSIKKNKLFSSANGSTDSDIVLSDLRSTFAKMKEKVDNTIHYFEDRGLPFTAQDVKDEYTKGHYHGSELQFVENCHKAYIEDLYKKNSSRKTIKSYESTFNVLSSYYKSRNPRNKMSELRLVQMDYEFLLGYDNYLTEVEKDSPATISAHNRYFRALFNYAIQKNAIPTNAYPYGKGEGKYQIQGVRKTQKALTLEELQRLVEFRPKVQKRQLRNLDLALLSFAMNGANMIDIATLTYGENYDEFSNTIKFYRHKTKKSKSSLSPVTIPISDTIRDYIRLYGNEQRPENYIFAIIDKNSSTPIEFQVGNTVRAINKTLKCVAKQCQVREDLSYQFFRHTFATLSLTNAKVGIYDIMTSMGHTSTKTTERYIASLPTNGKDPISEMKEKILSNIKI